jgi:uncharacterized protein (TIGR02145 family)
MKRILYLFVGLLFLFSCEYQDNGVTSINETITQGYLLAGNLDVYLDKDQIFRYTGKPGVEEVPIGSTNLSKYEDCFKLYVSSGTTSATIVTSAIIKLDGMVVLSTSDFPINSDPYQFEVCKLTEASVLSIEVRGQPDSFIEVWIEGKKKEECPCTVKDIDENIYNTVTIGDQCWMKENLKVIHFNDGTPIPYLLDIADWANITTPGGYCWANNDPASSKNAYGALYHWHSVSTNKLCPVGWHVPSDEEWKILEMYLGMPQAQADVYGWRGTDQGTQLKSATQWNGTNTSGFSGVPTSWYRDGSIISNSAYPGGITHLWTSTLGDAGTSNATGWAWYRILYGPQNGVMRRGYSLNIANSVRCIKD